MAAVTPGTPPGFSPWAARIPNTSRGGDDHGGIAAFTRAVTLQRRPASFIEVPATDAPVLAREWLGFHKYGNNSGYDEDGAVSPTSSAASLPLGHVTTGTGGTSGAALIHQHHAAAARGSVPSSERVRTGSTRAGSASAVVRAHKHQRPSPRHKHHKHQTRRTLPSRTPSPEVEAGSPRRPPRGVSPDASLLIEAPSNSPRASTIANVGDHGSGSDSDKESMVGARSTAATPFGSFRLDDESYSSNSAGGRAQQATRRTPLPRYQRPRVVVSKVTVSPRGSDRHRRLGPRRSRRLPVGRIHVTARRVPQPMPSRTIGSLPLVAEQPTSPAHGTSPPRKRATVSVVTGAMSSLGLAVGDHQAQPGFVPHPPPLLLAPAPVTPAGATQLTAAQPSRTVHTWPASQGPITVPWPGLDVDGVSPRRHGPVPPAPSRQHPAATAGMMAQSAALKSIRVVTEDGPTSILLSRSIVLSSDATQPQSQPQPQRHHQHLHQYQHQLERRVQESQQQQQHQQRWVAVGTTTQSQAPHRRRTRPRPKAVQAAEPVTLQDLTPEVASHTAAAVLGALGHKAKEHQYGRAESTQEAPAAPTRPPRHANGRSAAPSLRARRGMFDVTAVDPLDAAKARIKAFAEKRRQDRKQAKRMAALEQQQQQPSVQTQRLEYSHNVQRWMTKHGQRERVEQARDKMVMLRRWFELLDTDKSGEIGLSELEEPLVSTGLARSRQDVQDLISIVDEDENGEIGFDEFLDLLTSDHRGAGHEFFAHLHQTDNQDVAGGNGEEGGGGSDRSGAASAGASASSGSRKRRWRRMQQLKRQAAQAASKAKWAGIVRDHDRAREKKSNGGPSSLGGGRGAPVRGGRRARRNTVAVQRQHRAGPVPVPRSGQGNAAELQLVKQTFKDKENPVVALFKELAAGTLGDQAVPFQLAIAAYRRRMLMNAGMASSAAERSEGARVMRALKETRWAKMQDEVDAMGAAMKVDYSSGGLATMSSGADIGITQHGKDGGSPRAAEGTRMRLLSSS